MRNVAIIGAFALFAGSVQAADWIAPPAPPAPPAAMGVYVSLHGGVVFPQTAEATYLPTTTAEVTTEYGYRIGGAVGYLLNENFAFEGELSYRSAELSTAAIGINSVDVTGTASSFSVMGNAIFGADTGGFFPYIGIGAGAVNVALDVPVPNPFGPDLLSDNSWTWGVQALAGIDVEVADGVSLGGRYRYQYNGATEYTDGGNDPVSLTAFGAHSVEATLRFGM